MTIRFFGKNFENLETPKIKNISALKGNIFIFKMTLNSKRYWVFFGLKRSSEQEE